MRRGIERRRHRCRAEIPDAPFAVRTVRDSQVFGRGEATDRDRKRIADGVRIDLVIKSRLNICPSAKGTGKREQIPLKTLPWLPALERPANPIQEFAGPDLKASLHEIACAMNGNDRNISRPSAAKFRE